MGWRHGDDMVFIGERSIVNRTWDVLSKNLLMKKRAVLGFGPGDDKHISLLNRLITLEFVGGKRRITLEPDPRHVDLIIKGMGLRPGRSKGVSTPGCKSDDNYNTQPLEGDQATSYRSLTMRLMFLSLDLPHLQFVANKTAKFMSKPVIGGIVRLKRVARFLLANPRWAICFYEQEFCSTLIIRCDSD